MLNKMKSKKRIKLKKWVKRETIKFVITFSLGAFYGIYISQLPLPEEKNQTKVVTEVKAEEIEVPQNKIEEPSEMIEQEEYKCTLDSVSCLIEQITKNYGYDSYSNLFIAIAKHETGNYTSSAFKNKNNLGGMMSSKGLMTFSNIEEGTNAFVNNLINLYINQGLTSVEDIQKKYAPVGAKNDPTNLNSNWVSGVYYYLNELEGE